jgi:hypothetical protein
MNPQQNIVLVDGKGGYSRSGASLKGEDGYDHPGLDEAAHRENADSNLG